jgi:ABC-2 type transport system permease protein
MINLVRYGFLGVSDVAPWPTLLILSFVTFLLFWLNVRLFRRGYRLRA